MKIDRLLGILTILLQHEKITAPELADRFEVSKRTIHRDIDDICRAGIPIITYQGGNGGISIAEGYKLDKNVLSIEEMESIITGLKSLGSVSDTAKIEQLVTKLSPKKDAVVSMRDSIIIDLASHYKSSISEKISLFKKAISEKKLVKFKYFSEKGFSYRIIEAYFITFKWKDWYVFGFCTEKKDFRLFKLNRLWEQEILNSHFIPREVANEETALDDYFTDEFKISIIFDKSVEYLLVEEYGPNSYKKTEDGKLLFSVGYTNRNYMISWILRFGDKAKVIEPKDIVEEIKEIARNIVKSYDD